MDIGYHGQASITVAAGGELGITTTGDNYSDSQLAQLAETIVDYVSEIKKPAGERLPGFQEAELNSLRFQLFSPAPVYPEFEKAKLAGSLRLDLQQLGSEDPFLKLVLDGKTPEQVAEVFARPAHHRVQRRRRFMKLRSSITSLVLLVMIPLSAGAAPKESGVAPAEGVRVASLQLQVFLTTLSHLEASILEP